MANKIRLNLGCGNNLREGWENIDKMEKEGITYCNLDTPSVHLPFDDNSVDEFRMQHVLEHITQALPLMEECYRVAKPDAVFKIEVPYGLSDSAWGDPTHVRPYFIESWLYFSQPAYHRADYGYRGDWHTDSLEIDIQPAAMERLQGLSDQMVLEAIQTRPNTGQNIYATLHAVKPMRPREWDASARTALRIHRGPRQNEF